MRTVDGHLVDMTDDFDSDATTPLCVVNSTQRRHVLLTALVYVQTAR